MRRLVLALSVLLAGCGGVATRTASLATWVPTLDEAGILALADNAATVLTYSEARRRIDSVFVDSLQWTLYCGCQYDDRDQVSWADCGFSPRIPASGVLSGRDATLASQMTVEHVVPASWIGRQRDCWASGGRKACEGEDPVYDIIVADLVNLRPSIGQVNRDRSNFELGIIETPPWQYGACEFTVDFSARIAEPPLALQGDLARITLYMAYRYNIIMDAQYLALMEQWHLQDPVSTEECRLNMRITAEQGRGNPLVEQGC